MTLEQNIPEPLQWQKHNPDRMAVYDGDTFLVAIEVKDSKTGKFHWEVDKIRIACDWDGESGFFDLIYANCENCSSYYAWEWEDFTYSIKLT